MGIATLIVQDGRSAETRFLPAYIADDTAPIVVRVDDVHSSDVRDYLD